MSICVSASWINGQSLGHGIQAYEHMCVCRRLLAIPCPWWEHEGHDKLLLKLRNQCYLYVVLVVVVVVPFVHTALMATCMASDWLAVLVTRWMVLFWAVVLLVIAEDDVAVAALIR